MSKVELFMIREACGLFLSSKHNTYSSFANAVEMGVYFNTRKAAEKRLKSIISEDRQSYSRYTLETFSSTEPVWIKDPAGEGFIINPNYLAIQFTPFEQHVRSEPGFELRYRPLNIQVVSVYLTYNHVE